MLSLPECSGLFDLVRMARVDVKVVLLGQQSIGEVACCIAAAKSFFAPVNTTSETRLPLTLPFCRQVLFVGSVHYWVL